MLPENKWRCDDCKYFTYNKFFDASGVISVPKHVPKRSVSIFIDVLTYNEGKQAYAGDCFIHSLAAV